MPRRSSARQREEAKAMRLQVVLCQLCFPSPQTLPCPSGPGSDSPYKSPARSVRGCGQPKASSELGTQPRSRCGALSDIQPGCARHTASSLATPVLCSTLAKSKQPSLSQPHLLQPGTGLKFTPLRSNLACTPKRGQVLGPSRALLAQFSQEIRAM